MRVVIAPLTFGIAFIAWLIYRLFITKDIRKHWNEALFGVFFFGVWALLFWWIFS